MFCLETIVPLSVALFLHLLTAASMGGGSISPENRFVKVEVSLADTVLQPGSKGKILVSFTPIDGIHINVDPPVGITLDRDRVVSLHGNPGMTTDKETGFLSCPTPVEQRFSVSRKAGPGEHSITGTITYYLCSDTEGWCRKQSQVVRLTLNIQGH